MKMEVKNLTQSAELLELRPINVVTVSQYRQSLREGAIFPLITIDQNKVIVKGNHRYTMYLEECGEDYEIEVISKTYKSHKERIVDFTKDNIKNALPLTSFSRKKITLKLIILGSSPEEVAKLLGNSVKKIITYGNNVVAVVGKDGTETLKALKRGYEHMAGKTVPEEEYIDHSKIDRGIPILAKTRELTSNLNRGGDKKEWVEVTNDSINALKNLKIAIEKFHT